MEPRPAATVVVARASARPPAGVEVPLLRRAHRSRFAPGFVVFPGGALDPGDEDLAEHWFGDAREASRACAVRELAEETGLVLTGSGLRGLASSERPLDAIAADPPARGQLHEIARWVAPEFLTVRFDASFFAVAATGGLDVHPDGMETQPPLRGAGRSPEWHKPAGSPPP